MTNVVQGDMSGVQAGTIHGDVHYHPPERPTDDAPEIFGHVPETNEEINYVIGHRPWSWEYLLYAGSLQVGLHHIKQKSTNRSNSPLTITSKDAAIKHVSTLLAELQAAVEDVMNCFDPELMSKALGEPGRPGEWRLTCAIARRLIAVYEKLQNWSISVREAEVPRQTRRLFNILSHIADRPMLEIDEFVQHFVTQLNDMIGKASQGMTDAQVLTLTCEIAVDEKLMAELIKEAERANRRW
ncbi:hypothetical protein [Kutzneria viridogrisea]|uniref:hypothetical protein n=1 Tax=Kutzneria viridogrisea TaxID=47990 RepID=UPI00398CBDAF